MIDKDGGGTLSTDEIVTAVKEDKEVIKFLETCGEPNLQFLTRPARLKKALEVLDEDGSGEIDIHEWELAIQRGLAKRLEQLAIERERRDRAAMAADEEFTTEFLNAAREVFIMARDRRRSLPSKPSRGDSVRWERRHCARARDATGTHGSFAHRSTSTSRATWRRRKLSTP